MCPKSRSNQVRLIAGEWRGRKIQVTEAPGLRPTLNRVRETLFNWLMSYTPGARALDLFAGTGALGLEALSRGAHHVTFVDQNRRACASISNALSELGESGGARTQITPTNADTFLSHYTGPPFDLVFLDPPFDFPVLHEIAERLTDEQLLNNNAMVYLEWPSKSEMPELPSSWIEHRSSKVGDAAFALFRVSF